MGGKVQFINVSTNANSDYSKPADMDTTCMHALQSRGGACTRQIAWRLCSVVRCVVHHSFLPSSFVLRPSSFVLRCSSVVGRPFVVRPFVVRLLFLAAFLLSLLLSFLASFGRPVRKFTYSLVHWFFRSLARLFRLVSFVRSFAHASVRSSVRLFFGRGGDRKGKLSLTT